MTSLKFLFFVALAIACVFAAEERVKKDVFVGGYPYASGVYSGAYVPTAYNGYAHSAYSAYPGYHAGYYNHFY